MSQMATSTEPRKRPYVKSGKYSKKEVEVMPKTTSGMEIISVQPEQSEAPQFSASVEVVTAHLNFLQEAISVEEEAANAISMTAENRLKWFENQLKKAQQDYEVALQQYNQDVQISQFHSQNASYLRKQLSSMTTLADRSGNQKEFIPRNEFEISDCDDAA